MISVKVKHGAIVAPPIESVTLTMDLKDAMILRTIVGGIGGNPLLSEAREFVDRLFIALRSEGVKSFNHAVSLWDTPGGSVQFKDMDFGEPTGV